MHLQRMNWREAWLRFTGLFRVRRQEQELADELAFHLAMKQRKYQEQHGMDAQAAAEKVKRDFGGFERWKEVCRDVTRWRWLEDLGRDLALAVRMLRKSPVFTVVALMTLTLAIGANTAIFSLMNTVMLKALPVPSADQLVVLRQLPVDEGMNTGGYWFSYPVFRALKNQHDAPLAVFAFTGKTLQWRGASAGKVNGVEEVNGELVSGGYFQALGVQPRLGRWIADKDDRRGAPDGPVAVVSDRFCRSRLGGEANVIGRRITLNRIAFTIIGVMPDGFRGMNRDARPDVFIPFELEPDLDAPFNLIATGYMNWWFCIGGRLQNGATIERTNAYLKARSRQYFDRSQGDFTFNGHKFSELYLSAIPAANGFSRLRLRFGNSLLVLMGLVAMLLLIACLNLATLLMARASSRGREISTRFALGATRGRLLRQLLTESLLIAICGTLLGLALSPALAAFVAAVLAPQHDSLSTRLDVSPDLTVLGFTALVAIFATVLTGTLPALRSTKASLNGTLREGSASLRGSERRQAWPRVLLAFEVALAMVLVTGASLLGYSLVRLHRIPVGFEPRGLVYMPVESRQVQLSGKALMESYREALNRITKLPGVTGAALTSVIPLSENWSTGTVKTPGGTEHELWQAGAGSDYFHTMRMAVLQGREFAWTDTDATGKKAILNKLAAKLMFPKGNAVGQHVTLDGKTLVEVVGVVVDAKYTTLQDASPPTIYLPVTQDLKTGSSFNILMRTSGDPAPLISAASAIIRRAMPDAPVPGALSMEDTIAESLTSERMMAMLAVFFGGLALLMTGIGLYGTLAYATERRTGEIGIRLALGARRSNVISLVCWENGAIAMAGCLLGIAGSIMTSRVIASFLYGVSEHDPVVFGIAAIMLLSVAAAASLMPAVKAARIDPIAAIRYE